ncbi:MAG: type II pantothenate kinase [Clostridia bacterium]|nr:type II pantothenate kinase [Clostridia bacterium]
MGVILGIDVGGSTTKIVGFDHNRNLISPMFVKANDPLTSLYGAFGKFTDTNGIALSDIEKITVTGVGSSFINKPLYGVECEHISEFECIGLGGLYLSKLDRAVVVSMGTGTAIVQAEAGTDPVYLGGTGVGGGTLIGLSKQLIGVSDIDAIVELAKDGDLSNVDLVVSDITRKDLPGMSSNLTAANFGKLSDLATKNDLALGLINMIFESVAMLSLFASRASGINNIVMTGNLTTLEQAKPIFDSLTKIFNVNYIVPELSNFSTVIGAALSVMK